LKYPFRMAWIFGGRHFGGYTYEHWFDQETAPDAGEDSCAEVKTTAEASASAGEGSFGADGESLSRKDEDRRP
jgi:hypothetical protein